MRAVDPDRGSGTVLALGICALVIGLLVAGMALASAALASQGAASAADLSALAAASARAMGQPDPCLRAASVARANDALLVGCELLDDDSVQVTVSRAAQPTGLNLPAARAVARAGPA